MTLLFGLCDGTVNTVSAIVNWKKHSVNEVLKCDDTTIYRWVQRYVPEIEKRLRWYWQPRSDVGWQVDETFVKVKGKCPKDLEHRQVKHLNNRVEANHGQLSGSSILFGGFNR
jgi:transposase-like protein